MFLCIWFPHWPLQRVMVERPELQGHPVVLTEPHPRGGERVVHASRAAAACGIRPGMSVAEAMTLGSQRSGRSGGRNAENAPAHSPTSPIPHPQSHLLHLFPSDSLADCEALIRLAHDCHRFSPTVGLEEAERPESLLLDVTGIGKLFGGEDRLLEQATQALSARGYHVRPAIAPTIGAAWALAHYVGFGIWDVGFGASETNSQPQIPNLPSLPLAALRLPEKTLGLLAQLGIHRIEQLAALPRNQLESRFGPLPLRRLDQALGNIDEVIQPIHPPQTLSTEWPFEGATAEPEVIHAVIEKLLARLTPELTRRGHGATELTCRLDLQDRPPLVLEVGLYRPSATPKHLFELIRMQLEQKRFMNPVENVTVTIQRTQPLTEHQQELFADGRIHPSDGRLARLIDRLAGRLGHRGVVRPHLVRDAQPEFAVRYAPLVGSRARGRSRSLPTSGPLDRPLKLLPRPIPIRVVSLLPDGFPAQFIYRGRTCRVASHWGPERIETAWWRQGGIRRDYWRVETTNGARYWLFRRLRDLAWFLHGVF